MKADVKARPFGAGMPALHVIEGTWNMVADDRGRAITAIRRALELGLAHVDTAEMYGGAR